MSDEPTERDVEALAEVIDAHQYVPSGLRGVSRCSCGLQLHGMPHDHRAHLAAVLAERIAQARREGAAEVTTRVEDAIASITVQNENPAYAPIVVIREDALRAALRGDS